MFMDKFKDCVFYCFCIGVKYLIFKIILEILIYLSKIVKCMCILCKFIWLKIVYK